MIDMALAKKLRDAGFPQGDLEVGSMMDESFSEVISKETHTYEPTLSELIEACGDRFDSLVLHEKMANDGGYWEASGDEYFNGIGSTPEEAVANLYLALHN